jgi:hypothetical protein
MDIIINSLYQNKDIFLREVISNASDVSSVPQPRVIGAMTEVPLIATAGPGQNSLHVFDRP